KAAGRHREQRIETGLPPVERLAHAGVLGGKPRARVLQILDARLELVVIGLVEEVPRGQAQARAAVGGDGARRVEVSVMRERGRRIGSGARGDRCEHGSGDREPARPRHGYFTSVSVPTTAAVPCAGAAAPAAAPAASAVLTASGLSKIHSTRSKSGFAHAGAFASSGLTSGSMINALSTAKPPAAPT